MKNMFIVLMLFSFFIIGCGGEDDYIPPTVPTGVHVYNATPSTLNIIWNASSDDKGVSYGMGYYELIRDGRLVAVTALTGYIDTGLVNSSEYCYQVRALDMRANKSDFSEHACKRTTSPGVINSP